MKRLRILQTACALASLLMLAACTPDEVTDDTRLPEGKYPFTLTAEMDGLAATTRATADGSWDGNEKVAVQVKTGNEAAVKEYTAAKSTGALTSTDPFYWQKADETKQVSAWYLGTGYSGTRPSTWSVQSDQSKTESGKSNYQRSDFLYAPQTGISYKNKEKLPFYHQTAKVVINIRNAEPLTQVDQIKAVSINNVALNGTFSAPTTPGSYYGLTTDAPASTTPITPRKQGTPNTVIFEGSKTEAALASYEALVIPQTVKAGDKFIGITLNGNTYYYKAVADYNKLEAGHVHAYNITVQGGGDLKATVNTSIGWGDNGTSGSVSVDFGYTISDDGTWTVYNKEGLKAWADHVNTGNPSTNCTLAKDIDLVKPTTGESNWTAVGPAESIYSGTFDGNGHKISNLTAHIGMFNYIKNATIKNLNLEDINNSDNNDGANLSSVVQNANNSTIIACSVSGKVENNNAGHQNKTGGVVGILNGCTVVACYSTCSVTALSYVGGVVGQNSRSTMIGCYSSGSVSTSGSGAGSGAGGVVGYDNNGIYSACYWKKGSDSKPEKGVSNASTGVTGVTGVTEVTSSDWSAAITAMNNAIKTWNSNNDNKCQYHYVPGSGTGASPTLETGAPN
ncbi:fimbrillin family protein [Phocaeicola sp.]